MDARTPFRLGARAAISALEVSQWLARVAEDELRRRLGEPAPTATPAPDQAAPPRAAPATTQPRPADVAPRSGRIAGGRRRPPGRDAATVERIPAAPPTAAKTIDDRPELVDSEGPAESPGAEIRVDAPWNGYEQMTAADIVDRLAVADTATKAVVRLYEEQHKHRRTVLAATD